MSAFIQIIITTATRDEALRLALAGLPAAM